MTDNAEKDLQDLLEASEWVINVAHGIGKDGGVPSLHEQNEAMESYKCVATRIRARIQKTPDANGEIISPEAFDLSERTSGVIGFGTSIYVDPAGKALSPEELPEELRFKPIL